MFGSAANRLLSEQAWVWLLRSRDSEGTPNREMFASGQSPILNGQPVSRHDVFGAFRKPQTRKARNGLVEEDINVSSHVEVPCTQDC